MAKPDISWSHAESAEPTPSPPLRWVRWVVACLILLTIALMSHTSGRFARTALVEIRYWITDNTRIPTLAIPHSGFVNRLLPPSPVSTAGASAPSWIPPLAGARLTQSFGWHGTGAQARFDAGIQVTVARHASVLAGVAGRIQSVKANAVALTAQGGYLVTLTGIVPAKTVHVGEKVGPSTAIGRTSLPRVGIQVTRDGYPLNPLSSRLYGTRWLHG
ncbi:MAG: hypothetical protein M1272_00635 [Firmicutes bacterium]|nr:hypothetical protein [Bacillota bacterium]